MTEDQPARPGETPCEKTGLRRTQIKRGVDCLDTTVKSAQGTARYFAPTWDMVMEIKSKTISERMYAALYEARLERLSPEVWHWLHSAAQGGLVTLGCYCRDGAFCHSHLLIEFACARFPELFYDAREHPAEAGASTPAEKNQEGC